MSLSERLLAMPFFGSRAFASVGKRIFPRVDVTLQRLTRGHLSLAGAVRVPVLLLTASGRRTGVPHVTPLTYARDGHDFLVAGSNWGQRQQPNWALNLLAKPEAEIEIRGRRTFISAMPLDGTQRAEAWSLLMRVWPHFDAYEERSGERELFVFRLTPK